jgi:hypothetical protein
MLLTLSACFCMILCMRVYEPTGGPSAGDPMGTPTSPLSLSQHSKREREMRERAENG